MKKIFLCIAIFISFQSYAQIPEWKIRDFEQYIADHPGKILVFNFWATFCKPCVAEIPAMIRITDSLSAYHVQLILVSVDEKENYPKKLHLFVEKRNWKTNLRWLNESDADYFCPKVDSSWSGSIPATLIINTSKHYRAFYEEEFTAEKLRNAIMKAL